MNLLDYTKNNGTSTKRSSMGALLLSMLPYGLIYKSDAALWYKSENGSSKISTLIEDGYVVEYCKTVKGKRNTHLDKFLGLTARGISYLANVYGEDYPWLSTAASTLDEDETASFRSSHGEKTVSLILRAQSCNVFFNRAGVRTIFDRLRDNPYQALCAMRVVTTSTTMSDSFLNSLVAAMENWLKETRPAIREVPEEDAIRGEFYDSFEMRVPESNPYIEPGRICTPEEFTVKENRGKYRTSYIGTLHAGTRVFLVYRSTRDGARWNGASIKNNWTFVAVQLVRLGFYKAIPVVPDKFPAILFVDGAGKGVPSFVRVCKDPNHVRKTADKELGRGASYLSIMPMTTDAIQHMMAFVPMSSGEPPFDAQMKSAICAQWPGLFSRNPLGGAIDMMYKGMPCCFCMDFNARGINACLRDEQDRAELQKEGEPETSPAIFDYAVVCFKWQVKYIKALFPHAAKIIYIDPRQQKVFECRPAPEKDKGKGK